VVTGEVAVTVGAQQEGMVAGDAVNTAARVQSAAEPGRVLVDSSTRRLAAAAVSFDDAGKHTLKGKAEPEQLWRAARIIAGAGGNQRIDGLEAPLIGRDAEMRLVKELFHSGADRRTARLVVVTGAAGVGKSRLGWEFEKYIDGLAQTMWWHRGRCLSYGDGVTFWALAQAIRQRLGIAEDDATGVAARKITDGLAGLIPKPDEREFVALRVGRLLGAPVASDTGAPLAREELFAGWRLLFERMAAIDPVVWLIEDAQHADTGLLDFVDHLVDWARDLPIFVLVLSRAELTDTRPGFGVGRNRSLLALDQLDMVSMDSLVEALVPGMPESARTAITNHAQGVPLFAVETIRSLVDRDVVQPIDGVYRLVGEVGELAVPESLHGLLAARLDALDPAVRALVTDAAVLGSSFPAEALVAVSEQPDAAVRNGLDELVRREVLEVSADPLSPERGSYHFAQQLLRQVAYDTLSRRDRKSRHVSVAGHLRVSFADDGEEVADAIARHYRDALTAVPDDSDAEPIRAEAIAMSGRAGRRALRAGSPAAAVDSYVVAASLAEEVGLPEEAQWWERAADAADLAGLLEQAVTHARRAQTLYEATHRPRDAARARVIAGRNLGYLGRISEGREELSTALDVLRAEPDRDTVRALATLAGILNTAGDTRGREVAMEGLDLAQALGVEATQLAHSFTVAGVAYGLTDRVAMAAALLEYAAQVAERAGDRYSQCRALINICDVLAGFDPRAGSAAARQAVEIGRAVGASTQLSYAVVNHADTLLTLGEWDEVSALLRETASAGHTHEWVGGWEVLLHALRGDAEAARDLRSRINLREHSEDPQDLAHVEMINAAIADADGDPARSLRHARSALSHVDALGIRADMTRWSWMLAARAARNLGDTAALTTLVALVDSHPVGHVPPTIRTDADLARIQLGTVEPATADEVYERAIVTLRDLPAPYHLAWALLDRGRDEDITEAAAIAERLEATPLAERAAAKKAAQPA
jgi:tetratricopeptide (TPR) repeat protein